MSLKRAFAPLAGPDTRLLILGSLPGDASLAAGQYYAHPRNAFWKLVGGVIGDDLAARPYAERLERLAGARIGLWDVIASASRSGSLDAAIRDPRGADLAELIRALPRLEAVAFNGGTASRLGRRSLAEVDNAARLIDLPSSSPAHARPLSDKAAAWAV